MPMAFRSRDADRSFGVCTILRVGGSTVLEFDQVSKRSGASTDSHGLSVLTAAVDLAAFPNRLLYGFDLGVSHEGRWSVPRDMRAH